MKIFSFVLVQLLVTTTIMSQDGNLLQATINGKTFASAAQPLTLEKYQYVVAHTADPEKTLRIWLADVNGDPIKESGKYLMVKENDTYIYDRVFRSVWGTNQYKGIVSMKYIEATKPNGEEFLVGTSVFEGGTVEVKILPDGHVDLTFDAKLEAVKWSPGTVAPENAAKQRPPVQDIANATSFDLYRYPESYYQPKPEITSVQVSGGSVKFKKQ